MEYKYTARKEELTEDDGVPVGGIIISRGVISVTTNGSPYNTYTALVYIYEGKEFAIYLDKSTKTFRSVPLQEKST